MPDFLMGWGAQPGSNRMQSGNWNASKSCCMRGIIRKERNDVVSVPNRVGAAWSHACQWISRVATKVRPQTANSSSTRPRSSSLNTAACSPETPDRSSGIVRGYRFTW